MLEPYRAGAADRLHRQGLLRDIQIIHKKGNKIVEEMQHFCCNILEEEQERLESIQNMRSGLEQLSQLIEIISNQHHYLWFERLGAYIQPYLRRWRNLRGP